MEVKKIIIVLLIVCCFPLSMFLFSDNTKYKQIGKTNFYLLPDAQGQGAYLYHDSGSKDTFYPVIDNRIVCDVYWNQQYLVVKCSQSEKGEIKYWYVLKNIEDYDYQEFAIQEFFAEKAYRAVLDSIGLDEKKMEHTDGVILWRLGG